jgi:hypothetical protein
MTYNLSGSTFDFVFNGHGLVPGTDYTLVYYKDPWPGVPFGCLGTGIVDGEGNIHIEGSVNTGNLVDVKIWLALSIDVNCTEGMIRWTGAKYLLENNLITFDVVDVP